MPLHGRFEIPYHELKNSRMIFQNYRNQDVSWYYFGNIVEKEDAGMTITRIIGLIVLLIIIAVFGTLSYLKRKEKNVKEMKQ